MKKILFLFAVLMMCAKGEAADSDWGRTGHRATAEIAQSHLSKEAQKAINDLLDGHGLAFVANYADDIKSDYLAARQTWQEAMTKTFSQLNIGHYIANIDQPLDKTLHQFLAARQNLR